MTQPYKSTKLDMDKTAELELQVTTEEKKPRIFFIRRAPIHRVEREWVHPKDDQQYTKMLKEQGFITPDLVKGPISDELKIDIRELDQHLLPHFWRLDQQAKHFQNRYYQFQWLFILAAFLTTALASVNVLIYALGWEHGVDTGSFLGTLKAQQFLGFLTAVASGVAATVSFLDANQKPQKRWFKFRAQAESLRSLYFLFIARQNPFNRSEARARVQEMRRKTLEIITETTPTSDGSPRLTSTGSFRTPTPPPPVSESGGIHGAAVEFEIAPDDSAPTDSTPDDAPDDHPPAAAAAPDPAATDTQD
ncbi:MAG: DUF4231 domain-containing protein [Anaerolineae bacterium]|nr:DUF4231 domain-containing protein [Anaerolineae bacterium]